MHRDSTVRAVYYRLLFYAPFLPPKIPVSPLLPCGLRESPLGLDLSLLPPGVLSLAAAAPATTPPAAADTAETSAAAVGPPLSGGDPTPAVTPATPTLPPDAKGLLGIDSWSSDRPTAPETLLVAEGLLYVYPTKWVSLSLRPTFFCPPKREPSSWARNQYGQDVFEGGYASWWDCS